MNDRRKPTHIDIEAYERDIRKAVAGLFAETKVDDEEAMFVAAQKEFVEARIQISLAVSRGINAHLSINDIVAAGGAMLGQAAGSMIVELHTSHQAVFFHWFDESVQQILTNNIPTEDVGSAKHFTAPMTEGGNA